MKHFCFPVFNRATYGRVREVIKAIHAHEQLSVEVVISSHFNDDLAKEDYVTYELQGIPIHHLIVDTSDKSHAGSIKVTHQIIEAFSHYLKGKTFDGIIVFGDRFETLAPAIVSGYMNIPLIHISGGEVTGNIDERVRHAVTKLADYHFVGTRLAKKYLIQMGEDPVRVVYAGCPSIDLARNNFIKRYRSTEKYFICQFHPHTTESALAAKQTTVLAEAIIEYATKSGVHCYWYWPNPDPGREEVIAILEAAHRENKLFLIKAKNKPPEDFLYQLAGAKFIIGNSSAVIRESNYLGVPSINVGHRQSIRERGINVMDCEFDKDSLVKTMNIQDEQKKYPSHFLFGDGRASRIIASYLDKLDLSLKGPLTYPAWIQFREDHFGRSRFANHRKNRGNADYPAKAKNKAS